MDERMNQPFFTDNLTKEQFANEVTQLFDSKWITGYDYSAVPITKYSEKDLGNEIAENPHFFRNMCYVSRLVHCALLNDFSFFEELCDKDDLAIKEIDKWNSNGGLCIYSSVLLFGLLSYNKVADHSSMKYHQGFLEYEFPEGSLPKMFYPKTMGLHAWLTINGSVVDPSIMQLREHYGIEEEFHVTGQFIDGLQYHGYTEKDRTPFTYLEKIGNESTYGNLDKWIHHHYELSRKVAEKIIKTEIAK